MLLCEFIIEDPTKRENRKVPPAEIIKCRERFIVDRCRGKRVVNFGSNEGKLHEMIGEVAISAFGVDKDGDPDLKMDVDSFLWAKMYCFPAADVYVCGEIIEHLSNPGELLRKLWRDMAHGAELIITTPNAFSESTYRHMKAGYEVVNPDHVAYYSYFTLLRLIERAGFKLKEHYWYGGGDPGFNDGIIFVCTSAT